MGDLYASNRTGDNELEWIIHDCRSVLVLYAFDELTASLCDLDDLSTGEYQIGN